MVRQGCFVILLVVLGSAQGRPDGGWSPALETAAWNSVADSVVDLLNADQTRRGHQIVSLKDMDVAFNKKLGFLRLRGLFTAHDGWLSDATTARRMGDVQSEREGSKLKLAVALSWTDLRAGYGHYVLDVGKALQGSLEVNVRHNLVRAVFGFEMVGVDCKTTLEDVKILYLSDVDVRITGLGYLNFLAEQIGKWFLERRKDLIFNEIEEMIKDSVPEHLEDFYCDEYSAVFDTPL